MARDEQGNVFFEADEQEKINEIIAERLARAKKPDDYDDLVDISKQLEAFGFSGTPSEKAKAVKEYIESSSKPQQEIIDEVANTGEMPTKAVIEAMAKGFGTTPEKIEKAIKKQIQLDDADEQKKTSDAEWAKQVKDFEEKFTEVNLEQLNTDKKFLKFASKRVGTLIELYEDFKEFVGEAEAEAIGKFKSNADRSTGGGSTGSSGYGLTKDQAELLEDWNRKNPKFKMSAKEFKEALGG